MTPDTIAQIRAAKPPRYTPGSLATDTAEERAHYIAIMAKWNADLDRAIAQNRRARKG